MMETLSAFAAEHLSTQFAHPAALWLVLLLPVFAFLRFYYLRKGAAPLASVQHRGRSLPLNVIGLLLIETMLMLAVLIAVASPGKEGRLQSISEEGIDVALVLDISASMMAADFKPTRLDSLKKLAADFVERSGSDRIGVVLFAGEVFTQAPLTTDRKAVRELLSGISYYMIDHSRSGGTAIGDALLMTVDMLERRRIDGRDQALVLVTDGENDRGIDPKKVIPYLKERDVNLYVVGMAGDEKAPVFIDGQPFITVENKQLYTSLDDTSLRELTELGRGRYYRAKDEDALRSILKEIGSLNRTPLDVREIRTRRSDAWMAALAALLLFLIRQIYQIHFVRRPPL